MACRGPATTLAGLLALAALTALVLPACGGPVTVSTPAAGTPGTGLPSKPAVGLIGSYRVATASTVLTEPPAGPGLAARTLPVLFWYPQKGPRPAAGFPLVVFSQGYDIAVRSYATLLGDWASAGFVVAAPVYPGTSPGRGMNEADIVNHPVDLGFVLASLLAPAGGAGPATPAPVDAQEVGLAGHSDGGDVTLAVVADSCCRDAAVKAAAVLSGAELASFGGSYFTAGAVPLLVAQGSSDTVNAPACSAQLYDAAPAPKYYLDLLGAGHQPPYTGPGPYLPVVAEVTAAFFAAELTGAKWAPAAMTASGDAAGVARLSSGPSAPRAPGTCPGAPQTAPAAAASAQG